MLCECTFWLCVRVRNAICAASSRTQLRLPHVVNQETFNCWRHMYRVLRGSLYVSSITIDYYKIRTRAFYGAARCDCAGQVSTTFRYLAVVPCDSKTSRM